MSRKCRLRSREPLTPLEPLKTIMSAHRRTTVSAPKLGRDSVSRLSRPPQPLSRPSIAAFSPRCTSGAPSWSRKAAGSSAVADADVFLWQWGEQAEALGWTARDLFGLHRPPEKPHPSYRRLSRYDETGLIWLLRGRPVVALTADTAAIQSAAGNVTVYRRHHKPALGPVGDSLDDLDPGGRR